MKTSVTIKTKDNKNYSIGDPFILRFDGVYYLYPSAECDENGIRCFTSTDLKEFEEYGYVVEDEKLHNAYAPEVIYHDGYFLMCTSPNGNGHYFLKSDSPLGPFHFITENVKQMIDGTFLHDKDFNIYFARADHNGIAMLKYEDGKFSNRHNILPQISKAWTEGPTIFYEDDYYRATYCGNFVWSRNYRILSASSKSPTFGYVTESRPLLLSTMDGFHSLGHNSITRSYDLTKRLIAYHGRDKDNCNRHLYLDTLQFNGSSASVLFNDFPAIPDFEHRYDFKRTDEDVKIIDGDEFIAEFTFIEALNIKIQDDTRQNKELRLKDNRLILNDDKIYPLPIDTNKIHTLLLIKKMIQKESYFEIRIDEVPFLSSIKTSNTVTITLQKNSIVDYVAASKIKKNESFFIPNIIESTSLNHSDLVKHDHSYYLSLPSKKTIKVHGEKGRYQIYASCLVDSSATLSISTKSENKTVNIEHSDSDYDSRFLLLTDILIDENDELSIEVLSGEFSFSHLEISKPVTLPSSYENNYSFYPRKDEDEIHFTIHHFEEDSLFGMLLDAKDYCSHSSVHHPKCCGYLIGMRNDLLVVEHLQYETERIYDVPVSVKEGEEYTISYTKKDNHLTVYFDSKEMISIYLPFEEKDGYNGRYISSHSDVTIK